MIIDLENESEQSECDGAMPFRFLDLSLDLRKRILMEALCCDRIIRPYYNTGSLEATEMEVQISNYDTSVLSTSKQINQEAAAILYGQNAFYFMEPDLALWFFAHIGAMNLSLVRQVSLTMSSVALDSKQTNPFDVVDERLWQEFFAWLKPRHRIAEIELNFSLWQSLELPRSRGRSRSRKPAWNHITGWTMPEPVKDEYWFPRHQMQTARWRVLQILESYRGFKNVIVISGPQSSNPEAFLSSWEATHLANLMVWGRDEPVKVGTSMTQIIDFGQPF